MKIDNIEIQKEEINGDSYYKVIIEIEGYDYYCYWAGYKPDEKEIQETFKDCFDDGKTWLDLKN